MGNTDKLYEESFQNQGIDLKLILLLYMKKLWISIVWAAAGAILAGGLYFVTHVVYGPQREYEAVSKFYLTFAADDDGDAYQYYNGYTWNDLMGTEPIMDLILEEVSYDRKDVRNSITADILSDIRLLTVTIRSNDPEKTDIITEAVQNALIRFGENMEEFEKIEVIDHGKAALVVYDNETKRAMAAGLVIFFILSLLYLAIKAVLDDKIYVLGDVERILGINGLGYIFKEDPEWDKDRLMGNIDALKADDARYVVTTGMGEQLESDKVVKLEDVPPGMKVVLPIPYGMISSRELMRIISDLKMRSADIKGGIILGADDKLIKRYYGNFKSK